MDAVRPEVTMTQGLVALVQGGQMDKLHYDVSFLSYLRELCCQGITHLDEAIARWNEEHEPEGFTDCGRGREAMLAGCQCDACTNAGDDEYHRRKGC